MIEVTIKTLKNTVAKITIDENATFESQSELFKEAGGISDAPHMKLIHTGKVLDLSKTASSYAIASGDAIIVMKSAPPKPVVTSAPVVEPVPAPAPVQSAAAVSNSSAQPPQQVPPVDPIWLTPPATDTTQSYSIEQAHIILPMIISYIMQNPSLKLLMMTNPNILSEVMLTQNFRNIVRQLFAQSDNLLNAVRTGTPTSIYIGAEHGGSASAAANQTQPTMDQLTQALSGLTGTNGQPQMSMDQLTQAMNMLGMDPSMMDFVDDYGDEETDSHAGHDHSGHDHSHDHSHGSTGASTLTTQDQQNISQLMEVTGAQFPVAKQAYESAGKNMEVAGALLMQIMFN